MNEPTDVTSEAARLEQLWGGEFGDQYVDRNAGAYDQRAEFWRVLLERRPCKRVLEVGCNVGGNLRWIAANTPATGVHGVDINEKALASLRGEYPSINAQWSSARSLPYRDGWFDLVFTMGVLIHQPDSTLPLVMAEMVRCSRRWILAGEYFSGTTEEVSYRGHEGALFKRDYGTLFNDLFSELELVDQGFLGHDVGWDDITWWLFEKK